MTNELLLSNFYQLLLINKGNIEQSIEQLSVKTNLSKKDIKCSLKNIINNLHDGGNLL